MILLRPLAYLIVVIQVALVGVCIVLVVGVLILLAVLTGLDKARDFCG